MYGTTSTVPSLARHLTSRLALARGWLKDEDPMVLAFARKVVRRLEESRAYHEALEEEERLRYGS